jgi:CheY-like chemotaxis protein
LAGARVVVASDDAEVSDVLRTVLAWCGADVVAASIAEVLRLVPWFNPQLVIVDLPYERGDAFQIVRFMRNLKRFTEGGGGRLVAFTRYGPHHDERDSFEAGFHAQIEGPIDPPALEEALAAILTRPHA